MPRALAVLPALSLLVSALGLSSSGCGAAVERHSLDIVSPVWEPCSKLIDPNCTPVYASCADLGLTELKLTVGQFARETTTVACPAGLEKGRVGVDVAYRPGESFYMVDTSIVREGLLVYITAGPFPELDDKIPWRLHLR